MKNIDFKTLTRKIIYVSLGSFDKLLGRENNLVIYAYHNIINHPWVFNVQPSKFERQMSYLSSIGKFITLKELEQYFDGKIKLPQKSFAITFDDGYRGVKSVVEIAKKYGISPIVFALGREAHVDRNELKTKSGLLTTKEMKFLCEMGWQIGSHGLTHTKLTNLSKKEIEREIGGSKTFLESKVGSKVTSFAYPHGMYNSDAVSAVENQDYKLGFSMDDKIISRKTNRFVIPRVGVIGNHSDLEFKYLASPSVVGFRNIVKNTFLAKYI